MRTDISCALNGIGLADLDSRIYVEDVKEKVNISADTTKRSGYGLFPMNNPGRDSMTITVTFMLKERTRTSRAVLLQTVRGWCGDGWFTKNTRPTQRIYVFCTKEPEIDTFDVKTRYQIEFTAYGEAFWQYITPVTVKKTSAVSSATESITPTGTQKAFLEAEIAPSSGTLTSVTITVGTQVLALSGLSVTKTAPLKIFYDELHILHIESGGGSSLMSCRSAASVDDIVLVPGQANSISLAFSRACTYTLTARGLWKWMISEYGSRACWPKVRAAACWLRSAGCILSELSALR